MSAETATRATLTISDQRGAINLKLDKDEWKWSIPSDSLADIHAKEFTIVGCLTDSSRYVRLERAFATKSYPFGPRGCVVTVLGAFICMVSNDLSQDDLRKQWLITRIRLPLGPLHAWLNLSMPESIKCEDGFDVHYVREPVIEYMLTVGRLTVASDLSANADFAARTLTVKQEAWIEFSPGNSIGLEKAVDIFFDIEDLLVLLTDCEVSLDWPSLGFSETESTGVLYCTRRRREAAKFSAIECWLLFSHIRGNFGAIVERWFSLREEFGPAFHLYLGTRRGVHLYEEHRFVNLIWGLEALHRYTSGESISERATAKIERILASVDDSLNARDRKWLVQRLNQAMEPSLSDRLNSVLLEVPLRVSRDAIRKFAKRCADHRNDISHHGGPSRREGYSAFVLEVHQLAGALSHIYHAAILLRLGITKQQIERVFFDGFGSFIIRHRLQSAGLHLEVTPGALKPAASSHAQQPSRNSSKTQSRSPAMSKRVPERDGE